MNEWRDAPNKEWRVSKSQEGGKARDFDELQHKGYNNCLRARRIQLNYNRLHAKRLNGLDDR